MNQFKESIYLASKSPRRKKLFELLGIPFTVFPVLLDETIEDGEHPAMSVKRLALQKMDKAKAEIKNGIIITADTIVVLNNEIIGKPADPADAIKILNKLSGKTHHVYTGFMISNLATKNEKIDYQKTAVTFRNLSQNEISDYVSTGKPMDKAGAYGIQEDFGAVFVKSINGCYYNVVGLPLAKVYLTLKKLQQLD